jgi:DNA invertase Pin-like site-specific DNA recombinase
MKPAIAYIRYSSDRQSEGDSTRRQIETAKSYCASKGFSLEKIISDEGQSAYHGHNLSNGNLGKFLDEVDKFRGYAFVVEEVDRLSRQGVLATFELIGKLLSAGLEVHEINTSKVIKELDDLDSAETGILTAVRGILAKEHSRKLSVRVKAARSNERDQAREDGLAFTSLCPSWCIATPGQKIVLIESRAATVRRIFELAAEGLGCRRIVKTLEAEKREPFSVGSRGSKWAPEFVHRLLNNRSVLGEYQPHKVAQSNGKTVRVLNGEPIEHFFPTAVTQSLWNAARDMIDRKNHSKGVHGGNRGGGRYGSTHSIFGPIVYDLQNASLMGYWKKQGDHAYMVTRWQSGKKQHYIRYDRFEKAFLTFLEKLDWKSVAGHGESEEVTVATAQLEADLAEIDHSSRKIAQMQQLVDEGTFSKSLFEALDAEKARLVEATTRKEKHAAEVASARSKVQALHSPEELIQAIRAGNPELRMKLKAEIAKRVKRIDIQFEDRKPLAAEIIFINDYHQFLVFQP